MERMKSFHVTFIQKSDEDANFEEAWELCINGELTGWVYEEFQKDGKTYFQILVSNFSHVVKTHEEAKWLLFYEYASANSKEILVQA